MNRQGGATRWLSRALRSVAVVLAAVIGMFTAAPAPAALVTYAYDTVGYTYDGPALLSSPDTGATDARGSPSGREAGSWVSPVSVARDVVAAEDAGSVVGRYADMPRPRPGGVEAHHGVNSVWAKANVQGYSAADAPSVLMTADPSHNATRGVFNSWRQEIAARQGASVGGIDWTAVSPGSAWRLAEEQFQAAGTSARVVDEYFSQWNTYLGKVGWGG